MHWYTTSHKPNHHCLGTSTKTCLSLSTTTDPNLQRISFHIKTNTQNKHTKQTHFKILNYSTPSLPAVGWIKRTSLSHLPLYINFFNHKHSHHHHNYYHHIQNTYQFFFHIALFFPFESPNIVHINSPLALNSNTSIDTIMKTHILQHHPR